MSAAEAAAHLGVKKATLYAYVSRGLLESVADTAHPRRRRYLRSDLDRLKRRSDAHAGAGTAAATALDWGAPSLDTAISRITEEGPAYRGRPASELVRDGWGWEAVAELLWTEDLPEFPPRWLDDEAAPVALAGVVPADAWTIDVLRAATVLAGIRDPARFADAPDAELGLARRLVVSVLRSLAGHRGRPSTGATRVAELLLLTFGGGTTAAEVRAMDAVLVTMADHELNASTFAARVAASTGAELYACVDAALATFTGPRHGAACDRCAALISEVEADGSARSVLTGRMRRGEPPPGFGHRLYPAGDPRFATMGAIAGSLGPGRRSPALDDLLAAAGDMGLGAPTTDLGILLVTRALALPDEAAATIFAVGRMAGWIAHAREQRGQGWLLRPRARYVGR